MNLNEMEPNSTVTLNWDDQITQIMFPTRATSLLMDQHNADTGEDGKAVVMIIMAEDVNQNPQQAILIFDSAIQVGSIMEKALEMLFDEEGIEAIATTMSFQTSRMELSGSRPVIFKDMPDELKHQYVFDTDELHPLEVMEKEEHDG